MRSFLSRSRWLSQAIIALTLSLSFALSTTMLAFASGPVQISSDPYTNSSSQHQTQVEPDSYSWGSTIVAATQTGRFYDGGSSNIGWATSTDNGNTWTHGFLPKTTVYASPPGRYARVSDPAVAYDAAHNTWMISSLAIDSNATGVAVLVSRSTDGGLTWLKPVTVATANGSFLDKDWIVCDDTSSSPYYGRCYVEWDDNGNGNLIQMSTSKNGGASWGARKSTADFASGLGGQPLVQPSGKVIVPIDDASEGSVLAFNSTNGGASWSSTVTVSGINNAFDPGSMRAPPLPSAEIDASGKVYVVWADCSFENGCNTNDIVMSTSTNGTSWSGVQRIPIDSVNSGVDHLIPGIAVDKATSGNTAHLGLTFYYFPNGSQLYVGFVSSTNGGASWSSKTQLAGPMNTSWLASTNQGQMVGDYISTSIAGGLAFPYYEVATAPNGNTLHEALYSVQGGLSVKGGNHIASGDRVVAIHHSVGFDTAY